MSNVIQIGDYRFTRKRKAFTLHAECEHLYMIMDEDGHHVKCKDCGAALSAYWVLDRILTKIDRERERLAYERTKINDAKERGIHLIAARKVEEAWRSRTMVPTCPHCHAGIFPTDGFGNSHVNKEIEMRRREAEVRIGGEDT